MKTFKSFEIDDKIKKLETINLKLDKKKNLNNWIGSVDSSDINEINGEFVSADKFIKANDPKVKIFG